MKKIIKTDIAKYLQSVNGYSLEAAMNDTNAFVNTVSNLLSNGNSVQLHLLGTIAVTYKEERKGRNPMTGENHPISPRYVARLRNRTANTLRQKRAENLINKYTLRSEYIPIAPIITRFIRDSLLEGSQVELRGLGVFTLKQYDAYTFFNPITKVHSTTKELSFFHFKMSKKVRNNLIQLGAK